MANMELIKKYKLGERPQGNDPKKIHKEIKNLFSESKEFVIVLHLDTQNNIICREIVHIGGLNQSIMDPRAIFRTAITLNANSIVLAHNHPSGVLTPSDEDINSTAALKEGGEILGIKVLDHLIFNKTEYNSII